MFYTSFLYDFDLHQLFPFSIGDMHRARNTEGETVNGGQDFNRLFGIMQLVALQCRFLWPGLSLHIAWRGIPGAWYHRLVVIDFAILDHNPVRPGEPVGTSPGNKITGT